MDFWLNQKIIGMLVFNAKKCNAPVFGIDKFTKGDKFKLLVFTALSARTKDLTTLKACAKLFAKFINAEELAGADPNEVEKLIYGIGFYRVKAKSIIGIAKKLISDFDGKVPSDFESLISLPGIGRKTANVVLAHAFGKDAIGVDVHVHRISNRLGIVKTKTTMQTELELRRKIPKTLWKKINVALVAHGQTTCLPKNPKCEECAIRKWCKRIGI